MYEQWEKKSVGSPKQYTLLNFFQVPDFLNAKIDGLPVKEVIKDTKWLEEDFTQMVQTV